MKIVLRAFGGKLSGVMEVPEGTGIRFRLALEQKPEARHFGDDRDKHQTPSMPIETICEFEWTGGIFHQENHPWHKAREYRLINIDKK